jgi:hypothetical protein
LLWRQGNLTAHPLSTYEHASYQNRKKMADRVGLKMAESRTSERHFWDLSKKRRLEVLIIRGRELVMLIENRMNLHNKIGNVLVRITSH